MMRDLSWYDCAAAELGVEWRGRLVELDDWGIDGLAEQGSTDFLDALAELHPPTEEQL